MIRSLVILAHGSTVQAISPTADPYAITGARMAFACEHGVPPAEVSVTIEYATAFFEAAPTVTELAIINAE